MFGGLGWWLVVVYLLIWCRSCVWGALGGSLGGDKFWVGLYVAVTNCFVGLIFAGFWFVCFAVEGWLLYLRVCCFVW